MEQGGERNDAHVDSRQNSPSDLASTAFLERRVVFPTSITLRFQPRCILSCSPLHPFQHHGTHLRPQER